MASKILLVASLVTSLKLVFNEDTNIDVENLIRESIIDHADFDINDLNDKDFIEKIIESSANKIDTTLNIDELKENAAGVEDIMNYMKLQIDFSASQINPSKPFESLSTSIKDIHTAQTVINNRIDELRLNPNSLKDTNNLNLALREPEPEPIYNLAVFYPDSGSTQTGSEPEPEQIFRKCCGAARW